MYFTDLHRFNGNDRTVLGGEDEYKEYFTYLKAVFEKVLATYQQDMEGKEDEVLLLQHYLSCMLNSINALRNRYLFDPNFKLKIDQSDSSYPSSGEFRMLDDDSHCWEEKLALIKPAEVLRHDLIKAIYGMKKEYSDIQHNLAQRLYYESLSHSELFFLPFTKGELTRLGKSKGRVKYAYHCGVMENTLSVPLIYQIIFESTEDYESDAGKKYFDRFIEILAYTTTGLGDLINVAQSLERDCVDVYPKVLKRLIVGPLYGKYSAGSMDLASYIKSFDSTDIFALSVQSESLVSIHEINSGGSKAQQEYEFGQTPEIVFRQVTEYRELLFTLHQVGQQLLQQKELANEVLRLNIISIHT